VNHKIEIHSCNDAVETCEQLADLVEEVALQLRARGSASVYGQAGTTYHNIGSDGSTQGTWRIPAAHKDGTHE
jgi:hypothetical protein